jgi:hypothetical protein
MLVSLPYRGFLVSRGCGWRFAVPFHVLCRYQSGPCHERGGGNGDQQSIPCVIFHF